uniref:Uncharacterized protein n=1 Tax=Arundo donax TaxID=35708 RepID=A0A0A9B7G4_ARUDO
MSKSAKEFFFCVQHLFSMFF